MFENTIQIPFLPACRIHKSHLNNPDTFAGETHKCHNYHLHADLSRPSQTSDTNRPHLCRH